MMSSIPDFPRFRFQSHNILYTAPDDRVHI